MNPMPWFWPSGICRNGCAHIINELFCSLLECPVGQNLDSACVSACVSMVCTDDNRTSSEA